MLKLSGFAIQLSQGGFTILGSIRDAVKIVYSEFGNDALSIVGKGLKIWLMEWYLMMQQVIYQ